MITPAMPELVQRAINFYDGSPDGQYDEIAVQALRHYLAALQSQPAAAGVSDAEIDRILSTPIPGGSVASHWFLPHDTDKGLANVRDVVRAMLTSARAILALRPQSTGETFDQWLKREQPAGAVSDMERGWNACAASLRPQAVPMTDEPEWIVNDLGELGVRVGSRFFFLYKGDNIEYGKDGISDSRDGVALHDDGTPMHYRIVGKREFGETCWPLQWVVRGHSESRYTEPLTFIPGLSWGTPEDGEWKPLPGHGITAQGAQGGEG